MLGARRHPRLHAVHVTFKISLCGRGGLHHYHERLEIDKRRMLHEHHLMLMCRKRFVLISLNQAPRKSYPLFHKDKEKSYTSAQLVNSLLKIVRYGGATNTNLMKDNTSGPAQILDAVKCSLLLRYSRSIIKTSTAVSRVLMHTALNDHYHLNEPGHAVSTNVRESLTAGKVGAIMLQNISRIWHRMKRILHSHLSGSIQI